MHYSDNHMYRLVKKLEKLPPSLGCFLLTRLFSRRVPFVSTAGLRFDTVTPQRLVVSLRNRRKVQNHINGVHAAAMALLAETATGFVVGMNLPEDKLTLLKSMKINYLKRSQGDMRAVATLLPEQIQALYETDKGSVMVEVVVTDESGSSPICCEMVWAWKLKKTL